MTLSLLWGREKSLHLFTLAPAGRKYLFRSFPYRMDRLVKPCTAPDPIRSCWRINILIISTSLVASLILLVAMIGAIVLTLHKGVNVKRQEVFQQNTREFAKSCVQSFSLIPLRGKGPKPLSYPLRPQFVTPVTPKGLPLWG